jgi:hypothetical protein
MNRKFITGLVVLAVACLATSLGAQNPNYILSLTTASTTAGGSATIEAQVDNNGSALDGWSYGVCHNVAEALVTSVAAGPQMGTINGGSMAGFASLTITTVPSNGWTQGIVIDLFGVNKLPAGTQDFVMATGTYTVDAGYAAPGQIVVSYCNTLGTPPVADVVVVAGASIVPTELDGAIDVIDCPSPSFDYLAPNAGPANYPADAGAGSVSLVANFSIGETTASAPGCPPPGADTQGFSMGVSHDPSILDVTSVSEAGPLTALNGGTGAEFFTANLALANGWTVGVVYALQGGQFIVFSPAAPAVAVGYAGVAGALLGVAGPSSTPLTWDSGLGSPPVANVVVVGGGSIAANLVDGSVSLFGTTTLPFVAGDCNGDGITNIADIIWTLNQLFQGGPSRNCDIACDSNGNGSIDVADAVYSANYIFLLGPPPAGSLNCETVPSQTPEDCEQDNCS